MSDLTIGDQLALDALISLIRDHFITKGRVEPFIWPVGTSDRVTQACAFALALDGYIVEQGIARNYVKSNWIRIFR